MARPPVNIWDQAVECPTCGEILNVYAPDKSHLEASTSPRKPFSFLKIRELCSKGHPFDVYWSSR